MVDSITGSDLTTNEQLVDLFNERAIDLLRLEAGTRNKILTFLDDLETELVAQIAKADIGDAKGRKRLGALLKLVQETIRATYRDASVLMAQELREIIDQEYGWTAGAFNQSVGVQFIDGAITRKALENLVSDVLIQGAASKDWWSRQATGLSDRFADEMRKGVAIGETNDQLVARVRGTNTQRGIMDISKSSAERLVRASVQAAANTGREAMYADNNDIIKALQWSATLDTRTSIWCLTRDGHTYSPDEEHKPLDSGPKWLEGPGKLHWGCRSTSVPVLKTWREIGIDMNEIPETTRASMDGQVPAAMDFETWLKKQPTARQDTVLGAGKAELWRSGKITFRDLLDQGGRPLTTEELRAKAERRGK
jgi:SPP1 gp7 family putative phage head morphogenesis protein